MKSVLFLSLLVTIGTAVDCRQWTCTFPAQEPTPFSAMNPKCLSGPEWTERLAEMGSGAVARTLTLEPITYIPPNSWLSLNLITTIASIILSEAMAFPVYPTLLDGDLGYDAIYTDLACCQERNGVLFEAWWPTTKVADLSDDYLTGISQDGKEVNAYLLITAPLIGYSGSSGLYIPSEMLSRYPMLASWATHRYIPNYAETLPMAFSTPCEELLLNSSLPCQDDNYVCSLGSQYWECDRGRYVPPQCQGDNARYCREIIHTTPLWDTGFFEGLVKNLQLNFTIAYLGVERLPKYVAKKKDVIFYWWTPDPLVAKLRAEPIMFKPSNAECKQVETIFPNTSKNTCGFLSVAWRKLASSRSLKQDIDYKHFFESFTIYDGEMDRLMRTHTAGGGTLDTYNASCAWVQSNYATWNQWAKNTPVVASHATVVTENTYIVEIVTPIVVFAVVIMASLLGYIRFQKWLLKTRTRDVSLAPKTPEVALMFTDVQQSTMLWNTNREAMEKSIEVHHRTMRQVISRHRGYEVKTIGDSFFVVHSDPEVMLKLAFEAQRALLDAQWPVEILTTPDSCVEVDKNGVMTFKGLRVRMGIHFGPVNSVYDDVSKGFDFYGDAVNTAARVESVAFGGQTLISDAVFVRVKATLEALNAGHVLIGDVRLKGIAVAVKLHEVSLPDIPRVFEGVRESDTTSAGSIPKSRTSLTGAMRLREFDAQSDTTSHGSVPVVLSSPMRVDAPEVKDLTNMSMMELRDEVVRSRVKDVTNMSVMELRDEVFRSRAREGAAQFENEE